MLWRLALMFTHTFIGAAGGPVVKTFALYGKLPRGREFKSRSMQTVSERLQLSSLW